jgi:hypothetical protein
MKAAHITRARSRHLLGRPQDARHDEIAAMAAEIERLHARLRLLDLLDPKKIASEVKRLIRRDPPRLALLKSLRQVLAAGKPHVWQCGTSFRGCAPDCPGDLIERLIVALDPGQASAPVDGESKDGIASGVPGGGET